MKCGLKSTLTKSKLSAVNFMSNCLRHKILKIKLFCFIKDYYERASTKWGPKNRSTWFKFSITNFCVKLLSRTSANVGNAPSLLQSMFNY